MNDDCKIESKIRARCFRLSKRYTLKDLNELRNLESYRAMPTNILCSVDILAKGLGLHTMVTNGLSTTKKNRLKQIRFGKNLIGYKHYLSLIPNKNERNPNIHPLTPTVGINEDISKKTFDINVKKWKRDIHKWDAIHSVAEIPYHLLTERMLNERNMTSPTHKPNQTRLNSVHSYSQCSSAKKQWTPKQTPNMSTKSVNISSEKRELLGTFEIDLGNDGKISQISNEDSCRLTLQFDDDSKSAAVYSSTKNKWYKPKNGMAQSVNETMKFTKKEAMKYLKISLANVRAKNMNNKELNKCFDELLLCEYEKVLSKMHAQNI